MKKLREAVLFVFGACATLCAGALCACVVGNEPQTPRHTHVYGEWQVTDPDCINAGVRVRYCECGEEQSEIIPALGHDLKHYEGKQPSCEETGWEAYDICSRGDYNSYESIPALGHDLKHYEGQPPSCEEAGWKAYDVCSRGDYNSFEAIPATGHSYTSGWSYDNSVHWHAATCGHDLKKDEAQHVYNVNNVCTECGFELGYSAGLEFTLSANGEYYRVSKGTASGDIVIPDEYEGLPVTTIPDNAFLNGADVTSVTFGANIANIGLSAFEGCSAIENLVIPDTVVQIGRRAFYLCNSLKSISLPFIGETLESELNAHFGWIFGAKTASVNGEVVPQSLESVTIRNVTSIAVNAFLDCSYIRDIDLNEEIESIASSAFTNTNIERAFVSSNIVGYLPKTSIKHVTVKSGSIGANAFQGFNALESVEILEVPIIGYYAFRDCTALESVIFSGSVEEIIDYSFMGCTALKSLVIPDGVKSISNYSFADCTGIQSLTIGKNVTFIGTSAFMNCASIESVVIPKGVTSLSGTFSGCTALKNVTLPEGLQRLSGTFTGCVSLESITLPDSLTAFDGFTGCTSLKSIVVPDGVTSITRGALAGCSALEEMTVPFVGRDVKKPTDYSQYPLGWIFGTRAYAGCEATEQTYISFNLGVADGKNTYYIPSSLKKVTVTGGNILCGAFSNCVNITSVTLGSGINDIESGAFAGCTALSEVKFQTSDGWTVAESSDGEGVAIDVSLPSANAVVLTDTYLNYYWKRKA